MATKIAAAIKSFEDHSLKIFGTPVTGRVSSQPLPSTILGIRNQGSFHFGY